MTSLAARSVGLREPIVALSGAEKALLVAFLLLIAAYWVVLPTLAASSPPGDNIEQLNWSHSLEWGYFKHPPLSTWILHLAVFVFGRSAATSYATAVTCVVIAMLAIHRVTSMLVDARGATVAVLLASCVSYFCTKGWWFNHNTALLPFVAVSMLLFMRVLRRGVLIEWIALGLVCGLGMLVKYQFALFIIGYACGFAVAGIRSRAGTWTGLASGVAGAGVVCAPHLAWLAHHDFSTFRYAGESLLAQLDGPQRAWHSFAYLWQQVARAIPALIAFAIARAMSKRDAQAATVRVIAAPDLVRVVTVAAAIPFCAIPLISLIGGSAPQSHWGTATFIPLIPLSALVLARLQVRFALRGVLVAVLAVHALCGAWVASRHYSADPQSDSAAFPAAEFARSAEQMWNEFSEAPVPLVIGPSFEAGAIATYVAGRPPVLVNGDRAQAPWVTADRLRTCGGLVVHAPSPKNACADYADLADDLVEHRLVQVQVGAGRSASLCIGVIPPVEAGACTQ